MFIGLFCVYPSSILAQINDYQIRRLILYQSECQWDDIDNKQVVEDGVNYTISCQNVSFYPEGVLVHCSDIDDETTCRIKTKKKSFNLELMKQNEVD